MTYSLFLLHLSSDVSVISQKCSFVSCFSRAQSDKIKWKSIDLLKAKLFVWNFQIPWNSRTVVIHLSIWYPAKYFEMGISLWPPLVDEVWVLATNCDYLC